MKTLLTLLGVLALAATPVQAQCNNCNCTEKCSPSCECKHDQKPQAE